MNKLKIKMTKGDQVYGTWCSLSSPNALNAICYSGLDYCVIDLEHGSSSFETVENMVRAAETTNCEPIIRCWDGEKQNILRCLETGVKNILIPNITTSKEAQEVVKNCRYFPDGNRGLSPYTRCHEFDDNNLSISTKNNNDNLIVGILVEGEEALNNLDEISKIKGLDLIYLGLFDVCQSIGLPGQIDHPKVRDKLKQYNSIIHSNSKFSGCMSTTFENATLLKSLEYNFIAYLNDAVALKRFFSDFHKKLK